MKRIRKQFIICVLAVIIVILGASIYFIYAGENNQVTCKETEDGFEITLYDKRIE